MLAANGCFLVENYLALATYPIHAEQRRQLQSGSHTRIPRPAGRAAAGQHARGALRVRSVLLPGGHRRPGLRRGRRLDEVAGGADVRRAGPHRQRHRAGIPAVLRAPQPQRPLRHGQLRGGLPEPGALPVRQCAGGRRAQGEGPDAAVEGAAGPGRGPPGEGVVSLRGRGPVPGRRVGHAPPHGGGGVGGLSNRCNTAANPEKPGTCDTAPGPLAPRLRTDPELAEVVQVWKLLDEPIRAAIVQLVRVRPTRPAHRQGDKP